MKLTLEEAKQLFDLFIEEAEKCLEGKDGRSKYSAPIWFNHITKGLIEKLGFKLDELGEEKYNDFKTKMDNARGFFGKGKGLTEYITWGEHSRKGEVGIKVYGAYYENIIISASWSKASLLWKFIECDSNLTKDFEKWCKKNSEKNEIAEVMLLEEEKLFKEREKNKENLKKFLEEKKEIINKIKNYDDESRLKIHFYKAFKDDNLNNLENLVEYAESLEKFLKEKKEIIEEIEKLDDKVEIKDAYNKALKGGNLDQLKELVQYKESLENLLGNEELIKKIEKLDNKKSLFKQKFNAAIKGEDLTLSLFLKDLERYDDLEKIDINVGKEYKKDGSLECYLCAVMLQAIEENDVAKAAFFRNYFINFESKIKKSEFEGFIFKSLVQKFGIIELYDAMFSTDNEPKNNFEFLKYFKVLASSEKANKTQVNEAIYFIENTALKEVKFKNEVNFNDVKSDLKDKLKSLQEKEESKENEKDEEYLNIKKKVDEFTKSEKYEDAQKYLKEELKTCKDENILSIKKLLDEVTLIASSKNYKLKNLQKKEEFKENEKDEEYLKIKKIVDEFTKSEKYEDAQKYLKEELETCKENNILSLKILLDEVTLIVSSKAGKHFSYFGQTKYDYKGENSEGNRFLNNNHL